MEYRNVHNSGEGVKRYINHIENKTDMSDKQKKQVLDFVDKLRIGKIGKKVGDRKIGGYLQFLVKLHKYFKKDLDKITEAEAEQFYKDLQEDKIRKNNGTPYKADSKTMYITTLKRYLGYVWGRDNKKYHKSVRWMKDTKSTSSKKAITKEVMKKIVEKEEGLRNKCLFMFLFDSGARIEEALNVRLSDLTLKENKKKNYYIVHIRGQKTEEADRTIPIPIVTQLLRKWIKEHPIKDDQDTFLFPLQYDNARKIVRLMSSKILDKYLKPHELRHSSATHYIQYGGFGAENIGGFYYRYGWKFGSKEALTYIKQFMYGGDLGHQKVVDKIVSDDIEGMQKQIDVLKKDMERLIDMNMKRGQGTPLGIFAKHSNWDKDLDIADNMEKHDKKRKRH